MTPPRILLGLAAALAVTLLSGCKTGPKFDPRTDARSLTNLTAVTLTNQFHPEWLRPSSEPFTLGPDDTIELEVLGEATPRVPVQVGPDGRIYFHLLPGLDVWGLTLDQTKDLIERELRKYIREAPQVAVSLRMVGSKRVWLLGRLANPGVYPIAAPMSLLECISLAGGTLTPYGSSEDLADLRHSFIIRQGQLLTVDLHRLLREGDMSQNIYLQADDFLYLKSAEAQGIYVLGAVGRPNALPYRPNLTLLSAIALVGGPARDAYTAHVAIVRGSLSQPKIAIVDYQAIATGRESDVLLDPADIVYVPFSPFRTLNTYVDLITSSFVRTVAVNEGQRAITRSAAPVGVTFSTPTIPPR